MLTADHLPVEILGVTRSNKETVGLCSVKIEREGDRKI